MRSLLAVALLAVMTTPALAWNETDPDANEQRAAEAVSEPSPAEPTGNFTFRPRGAIDVDAVAFLVRAGGYDFNAGTTLRRARIGLEGTAFRKFKWQIGADFAGNAVNLGNVYLQYAMDPRWLVTVGQHKALFGLESANSGSDNMFLERGMFSNALGNAGAERRIGASVGYASETLNASIGMFGDKENFRRSASANESRGVNGRIAWEPIFRPGKILHVGLSGYYRTSLKSGDTADAVRLSDRPNIRIDGGNIADSGVITGVNSLRAIAAEAAGVFGPFTLAGEYGRLWLDRSGPINVVFDGFYVYGSWFITGETRPFDGGSFDRVKPFTNLGRNGFGAVELALRYDNLDQSDTPVPARAGNKAESLTLGLNWYLNPYAKLMFNWVRFNGTNTPLDPVGDKTKGDALATRLHLNF